MPMLSADVNRPEIVVELRELCSAYDRALIANDVDALVDFFWNDALARRFGVTEELYGADDISAFRKARVVDYSDRKTVNETLVTFGDSMAIAAVEFTATIAGSPRHGRQSQVWVRFADIGWRIVSAHVSHRVSPANAGAFGQSKAAAYVAAASDFLDMPIDPDFMPNVVNDIATMSKIIAPLMALDLSEIEPAPKFTA
ncbi:DUF3225 domain-containing protein [Croceicoccus ponticola]|uniref:DUF3225 domain-containing protein n=1 Tax=Croceicoccus ponticola TaxID=2217664 RepID=A0A437GUH8_9SPHN|nr:AtzH-like domain-containing protein [Croceicoccus ponticola]RVQ65139.1 DUF3225 domain-containing protein [Croceicoccus ponticola]